MYSGGHSGDGVVESVAVCAIPRLLYKWSHGTTSQLMEIPPLLVHPCQCQMVSIINKKCIMYICKLILTISPRTTGGNLVNSLSIFGIIDRK